MKLSDFSGKQWRVLLILMLVNFVNYVDRQIVFSLFPSIRRDFALSYVQLGYLATAFAVVLSLASFPRGMLADPISRRAVISVGVLFWSGATFFSGLAGWGRAAIVPIGFVLGAPTIYFSLHASGKIHFLLFFGLGAFFLSWYHGPLTATIHDLVPPRGHATALGFYYLFVNLFSVALAPVVIGRLADRYDLITALHIPILAPLAGAAFFVVVIQCIRHDGLRHPVLARHWDDAPCALAPEVALAIEKT